MNESVGFLKAMRSPMLVELLTRNPNAFRLLFFIAFTLNRDGSPNPYRCKLGESRVSYKACGLTDAQFRTAKKYLQVAGFAEFFTRGQGKGKKAYAKLSNTQLFDPNIVPKEHLFEQHNQPNCDIIDTSKHSVLSNCVSDNYKSEIDAHHLINNAIVPHNHQKSEPNINEEQEEKNKEQRKKKSGVNQPPEHCIELAEKLYQSILLVHPHMKRPATLNGWAHEIERIIRIDGKSKERVQEIIEYLPHDAFWCNNVLSANKLRKQFEKLEQAKLERETRKATSTSRYASKVKWAKQQCGPIHGSDPNAYFEFHETFLVVGDRRRDESTYTKIYFNSNGFEDQLDNALRKRGFK